MLGILEKVQVESGCGSKKKSFRIHSTAHETTTPMNTGCTKDIQYCMMCPLFFKFRPLLSTGFYYMEHSPIE
jgi:hypothetical protein